ncbi:hypothetical protein ABTN11_20235, partial [Acinetobacter baumannii]
LAFSQAHPVTLTSEAVLAAAQQQTGLSDFGPDDFRERLDVWMRAGDNDTELSAAGRGTLFSEAVRLAANRLQLEDTIKRHPEILDIPIER